MCSARFAPGDINCGQMITRDVNQRKDAPKGGNGGLRPCTVADGVHETDDSLRDQMCKCYDRSESLWKQALRGDQGCPTRWLKSKGYCAVLERIVLKGVVV